MLLNPAPLLLISVFSWSTAGLTYLSVTVGASGEARLVYGQGEDSLSSHGLLYLSFRVDVAPDPVSALEGLTIAANDEETAPTLSVSDYIVEENSVYLESGIGTFR